MRVTSVVVIAIAWMIGPQIALAQEAAQEIDIKKVYSYADSVDGRPVVDTLPQLINCPRFDPRDVQGDETTFSFQRVPELERGGELVRATFEFVVNRDGKVDRKTIRVLSSSNGRLERSLEYWLRSCRYTPGKIGDQTVRVLIKRDWEQRIES